MKKSTKTGFTLVELMIIIAILGILAAVAIPAFVSYLTKSKTSEAILNVDRIFEGAVTYFDNEHPGRTPSDGIQTKCLPSSVGFTPAVPPVQGWGQKYISADQMSVFKKNAVWRALKYNVQDNFYYQYAFSIVTAGCALPDATLILECQAQGDLDADGSYSLFVRSAGLVSGNIQGSSGVYKENPTE